MPALTPQPTTQKYQEYPPTFEAVQFNPELGASTFVMFGHNFDIEARFGGSMSFWANLWEDESVLEHSSPLQRVYPGDWIVKNDEDSRAEGLTDKQFRLRFYAVA